MKWFPRHSSLSVILIAFIVFYSFFRNEALLIPAFIALSGFFFKRFGEWVHISWMKLAHLMGRINRTVLLFLLYFLILTPVAWTARILGKINMRVNPKSKETGFINRNHRYTQEDLEFPW